MNSVGREETILNALAQTVSIERIAEVPVGVAVVLRNGVAVMPSWKAD